MHIGFILATAVKLKRRYATGYPPKISFDCEGQEAMLSHCSLSTHTYSCYSVKIACEEHASIIQFRSGPSQRHSLLNNVEIKNISGIHVTGTPPIFNNVKLVNSVEGIQILGAGPVNEKDIIVRKVH